MSDRVASVAGLRKAIGKLWEEDCQRHGCGNTAYKVGIDDCLVLISEFEAGVRENNLTDEEIELLEGWVVGFLYGSDRLSNEDYDKLKVAVEKLKRLCKSLGEGAEG